ncbi:ABC transporter ATP-binding protein [Lacibacterium aquatile]|uniref:ABC transporter ATP-binding protein n=1 Tax=Lacibacterium aquatile TaxID=1168082 RepID=A0ABW5DUB3_9PROT
MARLELEKIVKRFGNVVTIPGIDLTIEDKEFVVFVGPSGCGKSTLLRLIAGLEEASDGELRIDGERVNELDPAERGLAMVFQSYALYPHMSVYQNIAFGLEMAKLPNAEIDAKVRTVAATIQLDHLLDRKPKQLSGGQRQRVAIGRAIVRNPKAFLFDEPLSNLDAALRLQMRVEIARLHKELGATTIYVTHDQVEAMTLADKIVVLNGGRIEQVGSPMELYARPKNLFVAQFMGSPTMNILKGKAAGAEIALDNGNSIALPQASRIANGESVHLGVRPEHLVPTDGPAILSGDVMVVEQLGARSLVHLKTEGEGLTTVEVDAEHPIRVGERLALTAAVERCHLFNQSGDAVRAA